MPHLDRLRVQGYKSIDDLEVDLGQINIITGRNNSGKTSLLESVNLLFNTEDIRQFEGLANYLINVDQDSASISGYYMNQQSTLDEFSDTGTSLSNLGVEFRKPRDPEAIEAFIDVLHEILELNKRYPVAPSPLQDSPNIEEGVGEYNDLLSNSLRESASNLSGEELLGSGLKENILIIEHSGETYRYIHLGPYYEELREMLISRSIDRILEHNFVKDRFHNVPQEEIAEELYTSYDRLLAPRFGRPRFIGDPPPRLLGVTFLEEISGDKSEFDLEQENSAVKVSQIEQYLKSHDIMPDLKDFSFDKVVFERKNRDPYEIPYEFLGGGVKVLIRVLWELYGEGQEYSILLLEEPENHMHPGYIENLVLQLVNISRRSQIQILISTHDMDFINSFFAPYVPERNARFLRNNFKLIQQTGTASKVMNYETCENKINKLDLDLRGV